MAGFGLAFASCGGDSPPDDLAFRTVPTSVVGAPSTQLADLPLNEPLALAPEATTKVVAVATADTPRDAIRAPIVVRVDEVSPGDSTPAAFANEAPVTAGFIVHHPPSCGFEWLTDPNGDSWRVTNIASGSFEPPDDWVIAVTATDDVRLIARAGGQETILVHPDGAQTEIEYRSTPARVVCH